LVEHQLPKRAEPLHDVPESSCIRASGDLDANALQPAAAPNSAMQRARDQGSVAQPVPNDPVEVALATALERASAAGQWEAVLALARELEARRAAPTSAVVNKRSVR
jgi:hypothetical protein